MELLSCSLFCFYRLVGQNSSNLLNVLLETNDIDFSEGPFDLFGDLFNVIHIVELLPYSIY